MLKIMSGNSENTANSGKLAPMPISALLANLMPLQNNSDSPDCSYSSGDDSMNGLGDTVKVAPLQEVKRDIFTSTPKVAQHVYKQASEMKKLNILSEKNIYSYDKENYNDNSMSSRTYPNKDSQCVQSINKTAMSRVHPSTEMKQRNILMPQTNNNRILSSTTKKTPENSKHSNSGHKVKTSTPVIKSGIRKFTPNSSRLSNKKTSQKGKVGPKESVRCLFPDNQTQEEMRPPPQPVNPVHETPQSKKVLTQAPYAATPSYPQGVVGHHSKIMFKTTSIKGKNYMYIKKLGTGGSSEVYKVLEVATSREFAVKCVDLATDQDLAQGYINEVRLLRDLQDSDRVIKLYDYEYDRSSQLLRVVLEVGETDLSSFLRARGAGLPPVLVLHYWEEMLSAVHYIHSNGVIHADLKPANFLLVCGRLKLIDFGIASKIGSDATSVVRSQATGTYSYISPEALGAGQDATIKISFKSDVWSLGCILYSLVYGRTPFSHIPNLAKLAAILDPNHRIDYPPVEHLPPSLIAALKWCLVYNTRSRPSVQELLNIPYLQPTKSPLPSALLAKLQPLVTPAEFRVLQRAQI